MGLLSKNIKPIAEYQQWSASDVSNGDILGVFESLGNREAHSVTVESIGGASTIRFNVSKKIHRPHSQLHESWVGLGQGGTRRSGVLVDEIKETKPDIVIEANSTQTWLAMEICVHDIEIVTKSAGLKITVT